MTAQEIVSKVKELRELQALIEEAQAEAETIKDAIKTNMGGADVLVAGEYKKGRRKPQAGHSGAEQGSAGACCAVYQNHDGTPFLHCIREVSTWITIKLS